MFKNDFGSNPYQNFSLLFFLNSMVFPLYPKSAFESFLVLRSDLLHCMKDLGCPKSMELVVFLDPSFSS